MINRAVVAACDTLDGIKDGIISDPLQCRFDPKTLLCKGADANDCLTAVQVGAVRAIYDGARNPRTGQRIFAGWVRGSELGWNAYFVGKSEPARSDFWRYWIFGDPNWDPRTFDFEKDSAWAESQMASIVAMDPNLTAFRENKGKLLIYEGWADPVVPPDDVIEYYENIAHAMGGEQATRQFVRLFMAPGMSHCGGGVGPNQFDALAALDAWVSRSVPPDKIIASHSTQGVVDRTRPLCPYPQVARWKGKGDTDDAASFACLNELFRNDPHPPPTVK
jgi:feruloyl esterase